MAAPRFRPATSAEIGRLARTLTAARVFGDALELQAVSSAESWRVQVSSKGDVAVLGRWRDHLPYLSIEALWCPASRSATALAEIRRIATEHGMNDVISPPTPVEDMHFYESAGMRMHTLVSTYRLARSAEVPATHPLREASLRVAGAQDLPALLELDARCFDEFWRYDLRHLERFLASARLTVAERGGEVVGYTLCTLSGDEGLLGRLCVAPEWRRRGIGSALVRDAVGHVWEQGGRNVALSTQIDNAPSQELYRRERFRDTGRRYAFLRFGTDERVG